MLRAIFNAFVMFSVVYYMSLDIWLGVLLAAPIFIITLVDELEDND